MRKNAEIDNSPLQPYNDSIYAQISTCGRTHVAIFSSASAYV